MVPGVKRKAESQIDGCKSSTLIIILGHTHTVSNFVLFFNHSKLLQRFFFFFKVQKFFFLHVGLQLHACYVSARTHTHTHLWRPLPCFRHWPGDVSSAHWPAVFPEVCLHLKLRPFVLLLADSAASHLHWCTHTHDYTRDIKNTPHPALHYCEHRPYPLQQNPPSNLTTTTTTPTTRTAKSIKHEKPELLISTPSQCAF